MKKQKIQFMVVIVLLVVFVGGYFLMNSHVKKKEKQEEESSKIVAFTLDDYKNTKSFSYELNGKTMKLTNNGGKWTIESDSSVNVSRSTINSEMLSKLVEINASDKISSPSDVTDYGFTKKNEKITGSTNNITVTDSSGKNYEIYFGSANPYDSTLYYMMIKGDDNVYTVSSDLIEAFSKTVDDIEETTTEATTTVKETTTKSSNSETATENSITTKK